VIATARNVKFGIHIKNARFVGLEVGAKKGKLYEFRFGLP